jgi:hypothetical protein
MVTMQVPVPTHAPLQPPNVAPVAAVAVSVTAVPLATFAEHVDPQLIPPVLEVTVPLPVPDFVTVSGKVVPPVVLNVAVTDWAAVIVTTHVPVPVQAPPHAAKVEPLAAAAVRVTAVPLAMFAEQVDPQLIPPVLDVTVPLPVPDFVTVSA